MLLNCGAREDSWESLVLHGDKSILKEINHEYSLEGLLLKLKLQYFGHLMWRANSLEKTLILGKLEGRRRRGQQRMRWLDGTFNSMNMSVRWLRTGKPGVLQSMGSQRVGHDWETEQQQNLRGSTTTYNQGQKMPQEADMSQKGTCSYLYTHDSQIYISRSNVYLDLQTPTFNCLSDLYLNIFVIPNLTGF